MSPDPYVVAPSSSLDTVVRAMFRRRLSAAIVVENKKVLGVFTTTDALKALWKLLQDPSRGPSGNKKRGAKKSAAAASNKVPDVTGA
jgi:CBS domain-containing protein